jgi:hypothetical protein
MKKGSALKRTDNDPEVSPGGGVFVNEAEFQAFLSANENVPQVRVALWHTLV